MITLKLVKVPILSRYRCLMKEGSFRYWGPFPEQDTLLYNIWWPSIDAMIHGELTVDQTWNKWKLTPINKLQL